MEQNNAVSGPSLNNPTLDFNYTVQNGKTVLVKVDKGGEEHQITLASFYGWINEEEHKDSGFDRKTTFAVTGKSENGREFPTIHISAEAFSQMQWPLSHWGASAIIAPGQNNRDHLRAAFLEFSKNRKITTVYTHIGWRKIESEYYYLHARGGIGAEGNRPDISVDTSEGRLGDFVLPDPPANNELIVAVRASLELRNIGEKRIGYTLLASVARAPLGEMLVINFSTFYEGISGAFKTEGGTLAQQHFGLNFNSTNLPGNWSSSANFLEALMALAKDALLTIDDYVPGNVSDRDADRVFRGQANKSARGRMKADGSLRPSYYPRCLVQSTGEGLPKGQSKLARVSAVSIAPGDIGQEKLTELQRLGAEGKFAQTMSGYVKWLAPQVHTLKQSLSARHLKLRELASSVEMHKRTPDIQANLGVGLEQFLNFAHEVGAITNDEKMQIWTEGWAALTETAQMQKSNQEDEDHALRFIRLIDAAFVRGKAHLLASETGGEPVDSYRWGWRDKHPLGDKIGWLKEGAVLLNTDAAYGLAQQLAAMEQQPLHIGKKTLLKRLAQQNLLLIRDKNKNVTKLQTADGRETLIALSKDLFSSAPDAPQAPVVNGKDEAEKWTGTVKNFFDSQEQNTNNSENGGGAVR